MVPIVRIQKVALSTSVPVRRRTTMQRAASPPDTKRATIGEPFFDTRATPPVRPAPRPRAKSTRDAPERVPIAIANTQTTAKRVSRSASHGPT